MHEVAMTLPAQYQWLSRESSPRILVEFLKIHGVVEAPGALNNPIILQWANAIGLGHVYKSDAIAWCGLTMGYVAAQAGWDHAPRGNALWARNWAAWGTPVERGEEMLGDVLVFERGKVSGHVGEYVGEDPEAFHVIGGNQSDRVKITRIHRGRLIAARRCPWRVNQPPNVRKILLSPSGALSANEG
jgi:uncharacterized protein (TIGR02594 family)